ncbi:MAG: sigma 54-interacting transcriptional regulator [Candidatus Binatus sp.]|uniref:sigma-54 interaction domain-containing protein n=2 Tax=Candidatus Binatus sp. TaxID=2811406 RepID=UPI003BB08707
MGAKQMTAQTPSDDAALREIVEGVESETGDRFFYSLVKHLASALGCEYAFVSELLVDRLRFRTLAVWGRGTFLENFETPLDGTPCEAVLNGKSSHHPERICQLFPADVGLIRWRVESYCGVPLIDSSGTVVGHLAILSEQPMPDGPRGLAIMRIFAARARAELERLRTEDALRHANEALVQSEERFRDLFDEAPIAYVHEGLDSRFIEANRTAMRILGLKPEEIAEMTGKSLVPDIPEAQRRLGEWLDSMGHGTATTGTVLELRRKDDGKPVWIQCWSRPAPDGSYTRTMFIDVTDRVLMEREKARLEAQNTYLIEEIKETHNFEEIVGKSRALAEVIEKVKLVSSTDSSVLILGETGTGKELVARAVHSNSARRNRPLVKVNCAALPVGLIESELFGHEKGAFTGAIDRRIGRFELAHGGTIFLDEIGDMPPDLQAKLLRVLQEQEFERVGGSNLIKVDVRVIAATNRDLFRSASEGTFRQDLYYRLNVFPVQMPPLRERCEDIPPLVHYFVRRFSLKIGRKITRIQRETMERLMNYSWPGNVRELENVIERAVILSTGIELEVGPGVLPEIAAVASAQAFVPRPVPVEKGPEAPSPQSIDQVERNHILEVLMRTNWRIEGSDGAAALLHLNPSTLRSRMKKLGVQRSTQAVS